MAIADYCSSTRLALNTFVRGAVTDRFDRNLHVLRLNIDVTVAYMDDLDAATRYLQELLPDWSVSSKTGPVPLRAPSHFIASLFDLAPSRTVQSSGGA
jgi:hypothetical protein